MKIITSIFILLVYFRVNSFAQEIQLVDTTKWLCTYNYEFLEDSSSRYSLKSELMTLQVGSHLSKFESRNNLFQDSLLYATKDEDFESKSKKILASINNGYHSPVFCNYKIYKNFPDKEKLIFSAYQGGKFLRVTQNKAFPWEIDQSDTLMLGYHCQKAHTSFAGRNYIAWFTSEIPVSDGPYKFHGLPGLIVKISDTQTQHCFSLIKIQKIRYLQPIFYARSNYIDVTEKEYVKALYANIASLFGRIQSNNITITNDEGKAKSLQSLKARNNFIEKY